MRFIGRINMDCAKHRKGLLTSQILHRETIMVWNAYSTKYNVVIITTFLAYFPYFEKVKVGLCDHHALCVPPPPQSTFEWLNQSWGGVRLSSLGTLATNWHTVQGPNDRWV
jgi:hypothetical protein